MKYLHFLAGHYYKMREASNGYDHIYTVYNLSKIISNKLNIINKKDLLIIKCSALFHDVWDNKYISNEKEVISLKKELREDLKRINLNDSNIDDIYTIIDNISFTKEYNLNKLGERLYLGELNLLRDIVSDADKISSLGREGIIRMFIYEYFLDKEKDIDDYIFIIKKLYHNRFLPLINNNYIKTTYGKILAKPLILEMREIIYDESIMLELANTYCK
jgi:HD superfamily phosphodiesterase